jgi:hypothetical protein
MLSALSVAPPSLFRSEMDKDRGQMGGWQGLPTRYKDTSSRQGAADQCGKNMQVMLVDSRLLLAVCQAVRK